MDTKALQRVEIKNADRGEVSAVIATYNVLDRDGDVTIPGAFKAGQDVVISAYQHQTWGGALPVGKGRIRTTKSEAILDGQFFLTTTAGRDTFEVVKQLGARQQWSYGYDVLDAEQGTFEGKAAQFLKALDVHEASPVLIGAGVNTRTLAVKSLTERGVDPDAAVRLVDQAAPVSEYKAAIRPHETPVAAKAWDDLLAITTLDDTATIADLRGVFAWCDPAGDPELKSSYRYPHHDGPGGDANLRACLMHIADLISGKSAIPDDDRRGVYNHLAAHLADGDRDAPELRPAGDVGPLKFYEEAAVVMTAVNRLRRRASEVMALRAPKGKSLAASSVDVLEWTYDELRGLRTVLDSPQEDAARELARFLASLQITGEE